MKLKQISAKDFKEAVEWLWDNKENGGCSHKVLGTTDDGTKLCFVVGWANGRDYGDDDKKYGYFDDGYCISAKIGYQHRNNAMQADYEWDFNMPYDLETGDVWDTSSYVPRDADWEREAADYNRVSQKIWNAYCIPNEDGTAPIDLMESKKPSESNKRVCSMQKKKESLAKKSEEVSDELKGIDIPKGSILEEVTDWAEYVAEDYDGGIKAVLEDLMRNGVMSGMTHLISYEDGKNFFDAHRQEINDLLAEAWADQGQLPELRGFNKEDPLCLGEQNQFCLSAFAFEEVARDLLDRFDG